MSVNTLKLRLHIKLLKASDGTLANTQENIDEMIRGMQEVYSTASIEVEEIGPREILENSTQLADLFLTPCDGKPPLSTEQEELFNFRNGVAPNDIVAYFVRSITTCTCDGCANHPPNKQGVVVARGASKWTLAHEVGHLFLGFSHEDDVTNLMIETTTHDIEDPPPDLSEGQKVRLRANGQLQGFIMEIPPSTAAPVDLSIGAAEPIPSDEPPGNRSRSARRALLQPESSTGVTMEQVRAVINRDDADLEQAAVMLGAQALPYLEEILKEEHPRLAPRALNLAALIKDESTINIFRLAAASKDPVIRLTAAYNLRHLNISLVADLLLSFLNDQDLGVRKFALWAVGKDAPKEVWAKIEELKGDDPYAYIRQLSDQTLTRLNSLDWWQRTLNRVRNWFIS